ncbi:MAG: redoxin family protein [Oscillospiraceae bacterium]|nr:redoxin family protein [Oscillospiraceae bacterium]
MKRTYCKRLLCLALTLILALTLGTAALAADTAVVSSQKLTVDGENAPVTAYNIHDNNYFKLRDVACLLGDTPARFSVEYREETNSIHIVTGEPYTANGTELKSLGTESKEAVASRQTLYINGREDSSLTAYNIEGYNYFKLRDLGSALGFKVDYDEESRTMLIFTAETEPEPQPAALPADWAPDISFTTVDLEGNTWTDACFAGHKLTILNLWGYWCRPCVGELPELEQISKDYADRGVQMLGVYLAEDESGDIKTVEEMGVTYPSLLYAEAFDPYLNTGYFPTTIFLDGNGKVLGEAYIGSRNYASWTAIIEELLK